jgi:hypothetical protein
MRKREACAPYGYRKRVVGHGEPAAQGVPLAPVTPLPRGVPVLRRIVRHSSGGGADSSPGQKDFFSSGRENP